MTRARIAILTAFTIALLGSSVRAIETPKNARGFNPDSIYHFGNIDSINLFNGNVIVTLPIGQRYDVTSRFGYELMLSYNSYVWDVYNNIYGTYDYCEFNDGVRTLVPNQRSNAGVGWSIGYGRLFPPCLSDTGSASFESPDGGSHSLLSGTGTGPMMTSDNSHLRLRNWATNAAGPAFVDFPDGSTYAYTKRDCQEWLLESMTDSFGNVVHVSWDTPKLTETLVDPYGRQTVIHSVQVPVNNTYATVVDRVDVPTFNGQSATYHFHYDYPTMGVQFLPGSTACSNAHFVAPVLTSIDLPDLSTFVMTHYPSNVEMHKMTLPTGGSIAWDFNTWEIPGDTCKPQNFFNGLSRRTFHDPFTTTDEVWTYDSIVDPSPYDNTGYCQPDFSIPTVVPQVPKEQKRTVVISPKGDKTVHYFSIWRGTGGNSTPLPMDHSTNGFDPVEFGLPFTRLEQRPGLPNLFLSTREYDCRGAGCDDSHPDRSSYVQYETHSFEVPPVTAADQLPKTSRTYFESDTAPGTATYTETAQDDYDGYGHYRKVTTSGNFGPGGTIQSRIVTTNYNGAEPEVGMSSQVKPGSGTWTAGYVLPYTEAEPWILDTYTSITLEEGSGKSKQLFFLNRADGFLTRVRVRRGADNGFGVFFDSGSDTHDFVTAFTKTSAITDTAGLTIQPAGEVASETRYGGDVTPLASCASGVCDGQNALESFPLTSGKTINRTYAYGALSRETYAGAAFPVVDATIDRNTGAPRQFTDPAGHVHTMEYDTMGRIIKQVLPSGLVTRYVYTTANPPSHASASMTTYADSNSGTPLTQITYQYDAFGRIASVLQLMLAPNSPFVSTTHREIAWNTLGQKLSETEPALTGSYGVQTSYTYDAFGRITSVTPPDGPAHSIFNNYAGIRATTSTIGAITQNGTGGIGSDLAGGNVVEHPVSKTVENDTFGRMTKVTESSHAGATTTASYNYDVLDHLASVVMTAAEGTQTRRFTFDNRGLPVSETHPEVGLTTYDKYDVFGHALHKVQGAPGGPFDLSFVYDVNQRLTEVRQGSSGQTLVKQMTYDALPSGDPGAPYSEAGQLVKSYRRNFHSELGGDSAVNSYFHYDSTGRLDQKITAIGSGPSFTQHYAYDVLGDVTSLQYPTCSACAPVAGGTAIPARTLDFRWSHGYLTGVDQGLTHFTSTTAPIDYWPNGMIKTLTHVATDGSHPVTDSQTLYQGMVRPAEITFTGVTTCPAPDATINGPATINALASGSASAPSTTGAMYAWTISGGSFTSAINAASVTFTAACSGSVVLGVTVTASCGTAASQSLQIPIGGAAPPSISAQPADVTVGYGQTAQLSVVASGATSYQWYQLTDATNSAPIAGQTSATLQTAALTTTTRVWVRVTASSSCGTYVDSRVATITITLAAPQNLLATRFTDGTKITISWIGVPSNHYQLERRANNTLTYTDVSGTSTSDLSVSAGVTYVYRVRAVGSAPASGSADVSSYSNADLATMMAFFGVNTDTPITAAITEQLLTAVNAVNAASGRPAVTWVTILPSGVPAPARDVGIYAAHVMSIKDAMGVALDAVGVARPPGPNVTTGSPCSHTDIQQLQGWAQ